MRKSKKAQLILNHSSAAHYCLLAALREAKTKMIQTGDAGLVAALKKVDNSLTYHVAVWLMVRLIFFVGFGFVPWASGMPASTGLPPMSYQMPIFIAVVLGLIMTSSAPRMIVLPEFVILIISLFVLVGWSFVPIINTTWDCLSGAVLCPGNQAFIIIADVILAFIMTRGLLLATSGTYAFMSGYWQREYFLASNADYHQLTSDGEYYNYDDIDSDEEEPLKFNLRNARERAADRADRVGKKVETDYDRWEMFGANTEESRKANREAKKQLKKKPQKEEEEEEKEEETSDNDTASEADNSTTTAAEDAAGDGAVSTLSDTNAVELASVTTSGGAGTEDALTNKPSGYPFGSYGRVPLNMVGSDLQRRKH